MAAKLPVEHASGSSVPNDAGSRPPQKVTGCAHSTPLVLEHSFPSLSASLFLFSFLSLSRGMLRPPCPPPIALLLPALPPPG